MVAFVFNIRITQEYGSAVKGKWGTAFNVRV